MIVQVIQMILVRTVRVRVRVRMMKQKNQIKKHNGNLKKWKNEKHLNREENDNLQ